MDIEALHVCPRETVCLKEWWDLKILDFALTTWNHHIFHISHSLLNSEMVSQELHNAPHFEVTGMVTVPSCGRTIVYVQRDCWWVVLDFGTVWKTKTALFNQSVTQSTNVKWCDVFYWSALLNGSLTWTIQIGSHFLRVRTFSGSFLSWFTWT